MAYHSQTEHVQRRYSWLREKVEDKEFSLMKIHTQENGSNMLTKLLLADKFVVKTSHAVVKGEFVGKPFPPDGIRMRTRRARWDESKEGTGPDGSG